MIKNRIEYYDNLRVLAIGIIATVPIINSSRHAIYKPFIFSTLSIKLGFKDW